MVQCLRLRDAIVGVEDVIPGWITKVLHAFQCSQKIKEKKKRRRRNIEGMVTLRIIFLSNVGLTRYQE